MYCYWVGAVPNLNPNSHDKGSTGLMVFQSSGPQKRSKTSIARRVAGGLRGL